jgi:peptidoglycan/LPS O-acetylase OafA/YrhL
MPQINSRYFPALDGLRTICVSLVIFEHVGNLPDSLSNIQGWLGVDVFFLISGFLITTLLFREENAKKKIDLFAFYVRRFFRIVPLYVFVLSIYIVRAASNPQRWALMRHWLVYYLTMSMDILSAHIDVYNDYVGAKKPPFGATWSLGVEEKFYIIWPLLFFVLLPKKYRMLSIPVLIAVSALFPFRLFRSYVGLLIGCLLAIIIASTRGERLKKILARIPATAIVALMLFGFYLVNLKIEFVFLFSVIGSVLVAHLVLADSWLVNLLSTKPFVWVGQRSYSMYLVHMMLIDTVEYFIPHKTVLGSILVTTCAIASTALTAALLFRFVEEPARQFGKRILAKSRHTSSSVNPTVNPEGAGKILIES